MIGTPSLFLGYRRTDGRAGIRNHVIVLSTVNCASTVVEKIGRALEGRVVPITHPHGCGQGGADLAQTRRALLGTAAHPNVGAALLIGLGCETMDTAALAADVAAAGTPARHLLIQEEGDSTRTVARGIEIAEELLGAVEGLVREPLPLSDVTVAAECGASDGFSAITANPAVGLAADEWVAAGGTFVFSEVTECMGAEHILARRARDEATASCLLEHMGRRAREATAAGVDLMGAQINPGNFEGGLTTPEEKSLGAIYKGGSSRIQEVVPYAARPRRRGLVIMDSPGEDIESMVGMVAGGAHLVLFTTGRGTPAGNPIAPVIKIASTTELYRRMAEHMDLDAGTILAGGESIADVAGRILQRLRAVAGGEGTCSERLGHREFAVHRMGPTM